MVFGCWTSVSRKSVLPVFKELNGLLFYPVQYEGEELEKNVFYTGAAPNQQAIPAVEYLMSEDGGGALRAAGHDYVYPRTTNKILRAFLHSKGVKDSDIDEVTPFGHSDYQTIVANIKKFATGGKIAVISTINGDSNVPFYKELGNAGLKATDVPVVAFSVGEEELRGVDTKPLVGHLAAWNYFESIKTPVNTDFIAKAEGLKNLPNAATVVTNDPMEATYIGIHMWKQAVEQAKSTDVDKVIAAMGGQTFSSPSGFEIMMDKTNHHPLPVASARSRPTASSTWSGREVRSAPSPEPVYRATRQAGPLRRRPSCATLRSHATCVVFVCSWPGRRCPWRPASARTCWRRWRATIPTPGCVRSPRWARCPAAMARLCCGPWAPTSSTRRRTAALIGDGARAMTRPAAPRWTCRRDPRPSASTTACRAWLPGWLDWWRGRRRRWPSGHGAGGHGAGTHRDRSTAGPWKRCWRPGASA